MSATYGQDIGDTLAMINTYRVAVGAPPLYELPDAAPGVSTDCLYYRGLVDVGCQGVGGASMQWKNERQAQLAASLWGTSAHGVETTHPPQIAATIGRFDRHELAHYEVRED